MRESSAPVDAELDRHAVPFGSAAYGVILLLAARLFNVAESRLPDAARAVADLYERALVGGRAFGMGFAVSLLREIGEVTRVEDLAQRARVALDDPRTGYEDQVYLMQALWAAEPITGNGDGKLAEFSERILGASPGLLYIGRGTEDIAPVGDEETTIPISDLYRAMLLDIVLRVEQVADTRAVAVFNERYRGRRGVTTAAFGFYLVLIALVWLVVGGPLVAWYNVAEHFWIEQQFGAMSVWGVFLYSLDIALFTLLLPCTRAVVGALWDVLIRTHVESDRQVQDVVWSRLSKAAAQWKIVVAVAFVVSVLAAFVPPGLTHVLHLMRGK